MIKFPDKNAIRKKRFILVYSGLQFQVTAHHDSKVAVDELEGAGPTLRK